MRSFGKTMRNSLPAIGLGLMGVMGVVAVTAPAALGQAKASSEEFAIAFGEAKALVQAKNCTAAGPKIDQVISLGKGVAEKGAGANFKVYCAQILGNPTKIIEAIEQHRQIGGVDAATNERYNSTLMAAYDASRQPAKAMELAKAQVAAGKADHKIFGFLASKSLEAKDYASALSYGQKAIDLAGPKGSKDYYNIMLKAYLDQKKMDSYYATLEKAAVLYNDPNAYWKPLVDATRKQPKFKEAIYGVDLYRAFDQAKVQLTKDDKKMWGEYAMNRGVPLEADKILAPLVASGDFGGANDPKAGRNKGFYATILTEAKADKAGGLVKDEADAATKATGATYIAVGESYMAIGDYAKAIDAFQKGLTKGAMEPGDTDYAKLKLGIAQLKAGKKDDARKTWADVKADNGAAWLARVYTNLSKV